MGRYGMKRMIDLRGDVLSAASHQTLSPRRRPGPNFGGCAITEKNWAPACAGATVWIVAFLCCVSLIAHAQQPTNFAAPGRIEGASPTVRMGFPIMGTVKDILVKPGTRVAKGTVLASLICDDRQASVAAADAEHSGVRAQLAKLKAGSREEERKIANALAHAAEVDAQGSKNVAARFESLRMKGGAGGVITELQVDAANDAMKSAIARQNAVAAQTTLVNSPARREDIASADAIVAGAQAKLAIAKAEADKCVLRAPADTTVLKVLVERGDVVSITPPQTALTLSDTTKIRVRAEVDERFVDRVKISQSVTITSDFNPKLRVSGKVVSREAQMGRRTVLGIDPADKNDRDVLEAIVELDSRGVDSANALPVGYRVTVLF